MLGGEWPRTQSSIEKNLVGLTSFSLVPEPSTYTLLAMGAVGLMVGLRGRFVRVN